MSKMTCKFMSIIIASIVVMNTVVLSSADFINNDEDKWKEKVDPYILEIINQEETIPVWIWFEDIDQEEAEKKVFENTGLSVENLCEIDEEISEDLAIKLANLSSFSKEKKEDVRKEFKNYLDKTEGKRKEESIKTDMYLEELHFVQKEMLEEKTSEIIKDLKIDNNEIITSDTQAPTCIVNVKSKNIKKIAKSPKVMAIYYYEIPDIAEETSNNEISQVLAASTISKVQNEIGLTGAEVSVGIFDVGFVSASAYIGPERISYVSNLQSGHYGEHANFVARIAAGTDGIAKDACIYSAIMSDGLEIALPNFVDMGVNVINLSGYYNKAQRSEYTVEEIYLDYMISTKKFTFVKSAGNSHGLITIPGLSYNAITVGGFFNNGTANTNDDMMYKNSNYDNVVNGVQGCAKPDFVADQSYDSNGNTGTSYAAPYVTGVIAMLYELRPSLKIQPDVIKAILSASCHRKVTPIAGDLTETIYQGLTDSQGSGVIDPYMAIAIAGRGNYGVRYLYSNSTESQVRIKQPAYNSNGMNISIAWLVNPKDKYTIGTTIDLDLDVYAGVNKVGFSACDVSSTEMAYITPSYDEDNYKLKISRTENIEEVVRFAYAFSIDDEKYQYSNELEGVYYIRNSLNGAYLNYNDNEEITQELYTGNINQQWLINNNSIFPIANSNKGFINGDDLGVGYKKIGLRSYGKSYITLSPCMYGDCVDGSYLIYNTGNSAIVPFNNSSSVGTLVTWHSMSSSNNSQKWFLEPVSYQKGDINLDGVLSSTDIEILDDYLEGVLDLNNVQKYMADINGDESIDSIDLELLSQIAIN